MNIAFFGSPEIAKEILESIHNEFPVSFVVTQPDKPVGRKKEITSTPVKQFAIQKNIHVSTDSSIVRTIELFKYQSIDLAIVVAYGVIIPKELLDIPPYGFINVHYSFLPQYRGASPVQSAILNGDTETGVTIMKMDEELDHGEIISQQKIAIDQNDTTESLLNKLTELSKPLMIETIKYIQEHYAFPTLTTQDHTQATYCSRISKQDAFVEFEYITEALKGDELKVKLLYNKIRAYDPWPNVWTTLPNGKRCKIIKSVIPENKASRKSIATDSRFPACRQARRGNDKGFQITEIQIEGKQPTEDSNLINNLFR
ncbi:MAG: Methionyl-tRNA formyltransferase [Microgenomates group bacterium GW2011_GWC1_41_8]|uniref:Methionyl-tRNA formyltransferase n=2 Tax=Candidatus Roizmaniibacteriota TaxID=1752723 RepID=A0A0G0T329_9BACT|nr:MAG: Methionyl-tRNA formyltransferase [Candidatus Roizmanbacteria bacterium GW2011_GWB1_40_7]KKR93299.1 MAG: Methionyl-tRNA formyltransferase [Candidatus Roizmanbacteria bacterium GW2011_GWA1_41_13]KKS23361.1 MAG: Methionyl-tRNA formyltransferase [Microgenomates group bacterium GW2011_GWC1_41_8]OGK47751.1 MAG: methionyl-tRNA formyltransferase [Candidatus Roizmanbacteria bacterium RIFCSPLOWO2_01_FULL_40_14]